MNAQQLKISILQMAIQGKLVPQNPMDEPAATLLQRIHKERETLARSEKNGKIKNCSVIFRGSDNLLYEQCDKDKPICISDEFSFNIPNSWEVVRLNTVCKLTDGEKKSGVSYPVMDANFLRNKGNIKYSKSGKYAVKGEKLILVDGENSGEVFIAPQDGYLGSTFKKLWISKEVFEPYILNFIEFYRVPLKNSKRGAAIPHLNKEFFFNLLLPLPPLEEQRRIVESLYTLQQPIEEYRKAETSLEVINKNFPDQLKKSILQLTVQGKLIPQDPSDEPASTLLKRIREEKEQLINAGKIKRDKHESVICRKDNSYYETVDGVERCIDDELPFEIPTSWMWVRWGSLSESIQYGYNAPAKDNGRIKMVRISDIQDGKILWDSVPFCDIDDSQIANYLLEKNDILFARTGGTVGKSYLVTYVPYESVYAGYLIRTRYSNSLCPQYLKFFMESALYWTQLRSGTTVAAQPNCNGKTLSKMLIPLPPLPEQYRIVEKIEKLFHVISSL